MPILPILKNGKRRPFLHFLNDWILKSWLSGCLPQRMYYSNEVWMRLRQTYIFHFHFSSDTGCINYLLDSNFRGDCFGILHCRFFVNDFFYCKWPSPPFQTFAPKSRNKEYTTPGKSLIYQQDRGSLILGLRILESLKLCILEFF